MDYLLVGIVLVVVALVVALALVVPWRRRAGLPPAQRREDAATVTLDLRTAILGLLSLRINEPDLPWPPAVEQIDRFLTKLVGLHLPPMGDKSGTSAAVR